ncbi:hypothetical protein Tco_0714920 [Tanacetum coccineum]
MFDSRHFFPPEKISLPKDAETPIESPIPISPSSSVGSSSPMPPKRTSTSAAPAVTQAAIWQLVVDSVASALEVQAATMASTDNPNRNTGPRETHDYKVKFATGTLSEDALSWWNSYAKPIIIEQADKIAWTKLKRLLTNKYCPQTEVKKMEDNLQSWIVKENALKKMLEDYKN